MPLRKVLGKVLLTYRAVYHSYRVGDIVLVSEDKTPRGKWPLAHIIESYPGKDNLIHNFLLQTVKGQLKRPIQ